MPRLADLAGGEGHRDRGAGLRGRTRCRRPRSPRCRRRVARCAGGPELTLGTSRQGRASRTAPGRRRPLAHLRRPPPPPGQLSVIGSAAALRSTLTPSVTEVLPLPSTSQLLGCAVQLDVSPAALRSTCTPSVTVTLPLPSASPQTCAETPVAAPRLTEPGAHRHPYRRFVEMLALLSTLLGARSTRAFAGL